jgi:protein-L-isoaspartate(D-aspartate) O-methyltransferase
MNDLAARRRFFAEEIEAICNLQTPALVDALAAVPRERFLPPGPWTILSLNDYMPGAVTTSRVTPDADPKRVYHNIGIAIDASRHLFNGHPATLAVWVDALGLTPGARVLHIGCGLGYYTAVMAHCVGPAGRVVAVEVDDALAAGARTNLASLEWVDVRVGDGTSVDGGSFDAILVNAGVTHPEAAWLDALAPDGRLILPLTCAIGAMGPIGKGFVIKLSKRVDTFDAALVTMVAIYSAIGVRDPELNNRLGEALRRNAFPAIKRLRRDAHDQSPACWLHGSAFCLSA